MSWHALDADSLLQTLSFVNAEGLARMAQSSRLGMVVSFEASQRPALLVLKGSPEKVADDLRQQLAARPTVAFLQYSEGLGAQRSDEMLDFVRRHLPPETEVVGAATNSLQCVRGQRHGRARWPSPVMVTNDSHGELDEIGLLVATLPEATARAWRIEPSGRGGGSSDSSDEYSSDESEVELSPELAMDADPAAAAPCTANSAVAETATAADPASTSAGETQRDAPVRSQYDELLSMDPPPQVIVVNAAGRFTREVNELQAAFPQAAIIGGVVRGSKVLARSSKGGGGTQQQSAGEGLGVLTIAGNAPLFAMTCPYTGNRRAAEADVKRKMQMAKEEAAQQQREVLGALLFTCEARGPSLFRCEANDAKIFQEFFPQAPLLGYYAGGEIGPEAREDSPQDRESVFLRGRACGQGFTAVFGFFLVPRKQSPSLLFQRAVLHGEVQEAFQRLCRNT